MNFRDTGHDSGAHLGLRACVPDSICCSHAMGGSLLPLDWVALLLLDGCSFRAQGLWSTQGLALSQAKLKAGSPLQGILSPGPRGRTLRLSVLRDIGPWVQVPRFC